MNQEINLQYTTTQHVLHTYTKVTVTTCEDTPHVCEYRDFVLSALLSSHLYSSL
jgi:hypothetical protein